MRLQLQYNSDAQTPTAAGPAPADQGAKGFLAEIEVPTIPAIEPGGFTPPAPGNSPGKPKGPEPQPAPVYTPPEGAKPIFDAEDIPAPDEEKVDAAPAPKPVSKEYESTVIRAIITGEDKLTAAACAIVVREEDDSIFRSSEEDKDDIETMLEPYKGWILDKCPHWLPLIMVYGLVKGKQIKKAVILAKQNKANAAAAADGEKVRRVATAGNGNEERGNFSIYSDGYYSHNRIGEYISNREKNKRLLERPHIDDLEKILSVKGNRNPQKLKAAFGWTNEDCKKHGIE